MEAKQLSNELRSGNYINYISNPVQVSIKTIYAVSKVVGDSAMYQPILLNEQWLKDFGFQNLWGADYVIGELDTTLHKRDMYIYRNNKGFFYEDFRRQIKYVHQLQNLYFSLTNTELTLKK